MFRANFCPSSRAEDWDFFIQTYGIMSCWCGRQGFRACCWALRVRCECGCFTGVCKTPVKQFARNMLSWSWRSIKLLLLHLVGFHIYFTSKDEFVRKCQVESEEIFQTFTLKPDKSGIQHCSFGKIGTHHYAQTVRRTSWTTLCWNVLVRWINLINLAPDSWELI
jgi:hypothetical protein